VACNKQRRTQESYRVHDGAMASLESNKHNMEKSLFVTVVKTKYYCCMNCLLILNCDTSNGEQPCEFGFPTNYKSMSLMQYIAQKTLPAV